MEPSTSAYWRKCDLSARRVAPAAKQGGILTAARAAPISHAMLGAMQGKPGMIFIIEFFRIRLNDDARATLRSAFGALGCDKDPARFDEILKKTKEGPACRVLSPSRPAKDPRVQS